MRACMYVCVRVYTSVRVCERVRACMCAFVRACVRVRVCVCAMGVFNFDFCIACRALFSPYRLALYKYVMIIIIC